MQAEMPFFETPEDALKACVQALGGAKVVGSRLFPDKAMENARDYLLACLNPDRPEKLGYSQVIWIFRASKEKGYHGGFDWWSAQCEYEARPVSTAEQADKIGSIIDQATKTLAWAIPKLEQIQKAAPRN